MAINEVRHAQQLKDSRERVFLNEDTAIAKGVGLCYEYSAGENYVALPAVGIATTFAGVTTEAHAAVPGGQWIDISVPGSHCYILADETVAALDELVCSYNASTIGTWTDKNKASAAGRSVATCIEAKTIASGTDLVLAKLQEGVEYGCTNL